MIGAENQQVPYEESIRVPFVVRYDPIVAAPRADASLVLNIDLSPTFADLADVPAPGAEGKSLLPLLTSPSSSWRSDFLVEHHLSNLPSYCAVRDAGTVYVRYATGEEELYRLAADPYELAILASDPAMAGVLASMRVRAVQLCDPPPPGYSFVRPAPTWLRSDISTT
ncbi:MAG: sulfatase/phosphatase domain-containing protein [Actinomycetota bacterium]